MRQALRRLAVDVARPGRIGGKASKTIHGPEGSFHRLRVGDLRIMYDVITDDRVVLSRREAVLYAGYPTAQALIEAVRRTAQEQEAAEIPMGRLFCEFKRTSPDWSDPGACP